MDDLISRQAAINTLADMYCKSDEDGYLWIIRLDALARIDELPSAQPEITDEQAIEHLQSTGWMQNHDREMYESGLREQLADDSGSYDSLVSCDDAISRHAAIDFFLDKGMITAAVYVERMPSAQPEIIRCKECKKVPKCHGCNNLLPKDHYCLKYLRGVETAVYLCPFYCHWASDEERRTDE